MALDFLKPVTTDLMATILTNIKDMFNALVKMEPSTASNLPTDAKRWSITNNRFETWNGSAWVELMPQASTTVRGPTVLSNSVSSTSSATASTSLATKTVYDYAVAGFAALNGSNVTTGTVAAARLPAATTSAVGAVQLSSSTSSTSTVLAATASAVKAAYDYAVSGFAALNASNLSSGTVPDARLSWYAAERAAHVKAGNVQIYDGTISLGDTVRTLTSLQAELDWETYGPTGSGATNEWSVMDALPSNAKILICTAHLYIETSGSSYANLDLYVAKYSGSLLSSANHYSGSKAASVYADPSASSPTMGVAIDVEIMIPLGPDGIFQTSWVDSGSLTDRVVTLTYRGFITG